MMTHTTALLIAALLLVATSVSARWLGPDPDATNHPLDHWLASKMRTPLSNNLKSSSGAGLNNILGFGAIPGNTSLAACKINGEAFFKCLTQSNNGGTCLIPKGMEFSMEPYNASWIENLNNVTLLLNGNISASQHHESWPCPPGAGNECNNITRQQQQDGVFDPSRLTYNKVRKMNLIEIRNSVDFTFASANSDGSFGYVHGHGFSWWAEVFETHHDRRPNLINLESVTKLHVSGIVTTDSPMYNWYIGAAGALIEHVQVYTSVWNQQKLHARYGTLLPGVQLPSLTFPLNTDGIDVNGHHTVVRNCHVQNFDDSYCSKPRSLNQDGGTYNQLFVNSTVQFGVGCSVGSVPPNPNVNSAQNVTFSDIVSETPLKWIYVKPNPTGNVAVDRGIIKDILYQNMRGNFPLWWSIWVSTQQQVQPSQHGANTGCSFFYPLPGQTCPTDPDVPVTNLIIKNVTSHMPLLSPGVLRCNATTRYGPGTGPCTGWEWTDVNMGSSISKFPFGDHFLCHAIVAPKWTNVSPNCTFNDADDESHSMNKKTSGVEETVEQQKERELKILMWLGRLMKRNGIDMKTLLEKSKRATQHHFPQ